MEVKNDEDVPILEEPTEDDGSMIIEFNDDCEMNSSSWSFRSRSRRNTVGTGFASVVQAISVPMWMAKSFGYESQKKDLYISQDKV